MAPNIAAIRHHVEYNTLSFWLHFDTQVPSTSFWAAIQCHASRSARRVAQYACNSTPRALFLLLFHSAVLDAAPSNLRLTRATRLGAQLPLLFHSAVLDAAPSTLRLTRATRLGAQLPPLLVRPRLGAAVFEIELSPRLFSVDFCRLHQLWRFHTLDASVSKYEDSSP